MNEKCQDHSNVRTSKDQEAHVIETWRVSHTLLFPTKIESFLIARKTGENVDHVKSVILI